MNEDSETFPTQLTLSIAAPALTPPRQAIPGQWHARRVFRVLDAADLEIEDNLNAIRPRLRYGKKLLRGEDELTLKEASEVLTLCDRTLVRAIRKGFLHARKNILGHYRISVDEIRRFARTLVEEA